MQPPIFFQKRISKIYLHFVEGDCSIVWNVNTQHCSSLSNDIGQADMRIKSWIIKGFGIRVSDGPAWSFWASGE